MWLDFKGGEARPHSTAKNMVAISPRLEGKEEYHGFLMFSYTPLPSHNLPFLSWQIIVRKDDVRGPALPHLSPCHSHGNP